MAYRSCQLGFEQGLCWSIVHRAGELVQCYRAHEAQIEKSTLPLKQKKYFRLGIRKVRVTADERNEQDGM